MAFRLEIADFGAFYERTYDGAYRTALGIVRDPALAADVIQDGRSHWVLKLRVPICRSVPSLNLIV